MDTFPRSSLDRLHQRTKYRPDIDGLRALAIIPVVLFHAFPGHLPGGFVGVDIFFVISGFLISGIIFHELNQGRFSFPGFYARRIRRLFPALSLVLASTLIFGWFALDADEYKMLGKHVAAGAGFVQNFILWQEVGYFDIDSALKPLLHLWSLAIEEQFYIAFPLLVWIAWRIRLDLFALVLVIAVLSLTANLYWVSIDPGGAFYFPHTRIWELMAGAILAYLTWMSTNHTQLSDTQMRGRLYKTLSSTLGRLNVWSASTGKKIRLDKSVLSHLGLGLIVVSMFVFNKDQGYPGWRAMVPVIGAILIIYCGHHSWINRRLLGNKIVVFIGLISYPLYLWHWPLLSFARIIESEPLSVSLKTALIGISFVLATLTYWLIEKPVRSGSLKKFWTTALAITMVFVGVLGFLVHERELTSKLGARVQAVKEWENRHPAFEDYCAEYFPKWNIRRDSFKCAFLEKGKPEIAVIGDSHARRIFVGISHFLYEEHNVGLFANGCSMPFYDVAVGIPKRYRTSENLYPRAKQINQALDFSINDPSVKVLVLTTSACWGGIVDITNLKDKNAPRIVERKMRLTLDRLTQSGKQVIYVLDNPFLDFDPKSCISRPFRINSNKADCKMKRETFEEQRVQYFELVNRVLAEYPNIKVFDVASKLCDSEYCYAAINNELLYQDYSHLGFDGSIYVGRFMIPLIKDLLGEDN